MGCILWLQERPSNQFYLVLWAVRQSTCDIVEAISAISATSLSRSVCGIYWHLVVSCFASPFTTLLSSRGAVLSGTHSTLAWSFYGQANGGSSYPNYCNRFTTWSGVGSHKTSQGAIPIHCVRRPWWPLPDQVYWVCCHYGGTASMCTLWCG